MAYERGDGIVEVELARTQSWIEGADKDLYGHNGDLGVIREHRADRTERQTTLRIIKGAAFVCGSGGVVSILHLLVEIFHLAPK